jgi:pseudaminic acid cytidylyltransferase
MSSICIITARGGSKRIPKKNIKEFCGKPIIAYSIEAAINSKVFDKVIVSTDSQEIKEVALIYGAEVPFMRSSENSNDHATTVDVLSEVLEKYSNYDIFCCLYPTAPFLTGNILKQAQEKLIKTQAKSLVPIVEFSYPPQRCLSIQDDKIKFSHPEHIRTRSQDLEKKYHDVGQFYLGKVESFFKEKSLFTNNTTTLILDPMHVQDIDTLEDWKIAEFKFNYLNN